MLRFFTERMQSRAQQLQCAVFVCDGQRGGCIGLCGRHCNLYLEGGDELPPPPPPPRRRRLGLGADMKGAATDAVKGREGLKKESVSVAWSCIGRALAQQPSCKGIERLKRSC